MPAKALQLCRDPKDGSPTGSSVHGLLQAGILEWVAMLSSRIPSPPGVKPHLLCLLQWQAGSLTLAVPRKPSHEISFHTWVFIGIYYYMVLKNNVVMYLSIFYNLLLEYNKKSIFFYHVHGYMPSRWLKIGMYQLLYKYLVNESIIAIFFFYFNAPFLKLWIMSHDNLFGTVPVSVLLHMKIEIFTM